MKIATQNLTNSHLDIGSVKNAHRTQEVSKAVAKSSDYDKITIGATQSPGMPDTQFVNMLKKSIVSEIQAGASEYKINDLKQQVALNQYEINPAEIVRKMMLDSYEVSYE